MIKCAFRSLRKTPMFTAVAVLSLGLGIGANTAIFSQIDQALVRLLPVKNPKDLALLIMRGQFYGGNWGPNVISYPMYRDFQDHNHVFSVMLGRFPFSPSLTVNGSTDRVLGELVSGTFFPGLGVGAAIIGVAQRGFDGIELGNAPDVYVPIMMEPDAYRRIRSSSRAGACEGSTHTAD